MTLAELEEVLREARETGRPIERRLLNSDNWERWSGATFDRLNSIYRVQPTPEPPTPSPAEHTLAIRRNETDRGMIELCAKCRAGYAVFSVFPIWWLGGTGLLSRIREGETVTVRIVEAD